MFDAEGFALFFGMVTAAFEGIGLVIYFCIIMSPQYCICPGCLSICLSVCNKSISALQFFNLWRDFQITRYKRSSHLNR